MALPGDPESQSVRGDAPENAPLEERGAAEKAEVAAQIASVLGTREGPPETLAEIDAQLVAIGRHLLLEEQKGRLDLAEKAYAAAQAPIPAAELVAFADRFSHDPDALDEIIWVYESVGATEKLVALGDRLMRDGDPYFAGLAYDAAKHKVPDDVFLSAGERHLEADQYHEAQEAFLRAGATERLVATGDRALAAGSLHDGTASYELAEREAPAEKLVACGDKLRRAGKFDGAREAYARAGAAGKLVSLGGALLDAGNLAAARACYEAAGCDMPPAKLVALGDGARARGDFGVAMTVYTLAGSRGRLVSLGDDALASEEFNVAMNAYKLAGSTERLVAVGDSRFNEGNLEGAYAAYVLAGARDRIVAVADCWLARGDLQGARNLYASVKLAIPVSKLIAAGDRLVEQARPKDAVEAYVAAGAVTRLIERGFHEAALELLQVKRAALVRATTTAPTEE